jgi:sulfur carrier protein
MVKVNGQYIDCAGKSIAEFLAQTNYNPTRIAVERNEQIVPKSEYADAIIKDGDVIEVVSFVGGG